jgi:signal transduction histidine kinase
VLSVTVACSFFIMVQMITRTRSRVAIPYAMVVASAGLWALCSLLLLIVPTFEAKVFFTRARFVFIPMVSPALLYLMARHYSWNLPLRLFALVCIIPLTTVTLAITSPWHGLLMHSFQMGGPVDFPILMFKWGPWFTFQATWAYLIVMALVAAMVREAWRENAAYQRRTALLIAFMLLPSAVDITMLVLDLRIRFYQVMPVTFLLSVMILGFLILYRRAHEILPAAKERVFSLLRNPILIFDSGRRLVDLNPSARDLFFAQSPIPLGSKADEVFKELPDLQRPELWKEGSDVAPIEVELDHREHLRTFEVQVSFLPSGRLELGGLVMVFHEITERKELERQILKRDAIKGKFLSLISHDLSGNVANLSFLADVLERYVATETSSEVRAMIQSIQGSSRNMHELLRNLLAWTRRNQFQLDANLTDFALDQAVQETIEYLRPVAQTKHIEIISRVAPGFGVVADRDMMLAILRNLLSNAVKFTPDGGEITVLAARGHNQVTISIVDSGIGIPPSLAGSDALFQFHERRPARAVEGGYGLGLWMCRQFVESHGGTIRGERRPEGGSVFHVSIPLKDP